MIHTLCLLKTDNFSQQMNVQYNIYSKHSASQLELCMYVCMSMNIKDHIRIKSFEDWHNFHRVPMVHSIFNMLQVIIP